MTVPAYNTPYDIICDAMQDAGLLAEGQVPTSEQLAKYMRRLCDLVNTWQTQGLKLWLTQDIAVPLVGGQNTYTLGPGGSVDMAKPLRVLEAYYLYTATGVRRPLTALAWRDWISLGNAGTNASNQGAVSHYFVDKRQGQLAVTLWPCPNAQDAASGDVHLVLQVQARNPVELTETMNFPNEWRMALRWGLADDICTNQSPTVMARCQERALYYRSLLEAWDVDDVSVTFNSANGFASEFQ